MRTILLITILLIAACAVSASVPPMISYQGKLMQPGGTPVPDGTYSMQFAIYDVPTGGTALWSEPNPSVQVKGGLFATMLGSVVNLPSNVFDSPNRFFGMKVGTDPEMAPRQQVASSAFAFRAAIAGSVDSGAIGTAQLADGAVTTGKLADGAVTAAKIEAQQPWQPASLDNGWHDYSTGVGIAAFYKDSMGTVHLRAMVTGGSPVSRIFTLPAGYRPSCILMLAGDRGTPIDAGSPCRVDIWPDGEVIPYDSTASDWVSLSPISFRAEQ